jgi:hypothetical protein
MKIAKIDYSLIELGTCYFSMLVEYNWSPKMVSNWLWRVCNRETLICVCFPAFLLLLYIQSMNTMVSSYIPPIHDQTTWQGDQPLAVDCICSCCYAPLKPEMICIHRSLHLRWYFMMYITYEWLGLLNCSGMIIAHNQHRCIWSAFIATWRLFASSDRMDPSVSITTKL